MSKIGKKKSKIDMSVAPPFVQIATSPTNVYGLDKNGRVWVRFLDSNDRAAWNLLNNRRYDPKQEKP
jgi:hypothetical protein